MGSDAFRVAASPHFEADLDAAVGHALTFSGRCAALRLLDDYEAACERLAAFPLHGPGIAGTRWRWCRVGRYVAVYRVSGQRRLVELLRLYAMGSDWREAILGEGRACPGDAGRGGSA